MHVDDFPKDDVCDVVVSDDMGVQSSLFKSLTSHLSSPILIIYRVVGL